jgi:hypothetical protein
MTFDELIQQQGWNNITIIYILRSFISQYGLQTLLNTFAVEQAAMENGGTEP